MQALEPLKRLADYQEIVRFEEENGFFLQIAGWRFTDTSCSTRQWL